MSFQNFIAAGVDQVYWGTVDTDGNLLGSALAAPAAGDTAGSGMARLRGVTGVDGGLDEPEVVDVPGDNGSMGTFLFAPDGQPSFTVENSVFNMALKALTTGTNVYTPVVGGPTLAAVQPAPMVLPDTCWVLQGPAKKKGGALEGKSGWMGYIVNVATTYPMARNGFTQRAAASERYRLECQPAPRTPFGMVFGEATIGADTLSLLEFASDHPMCMHRWTGNNTQVAFILDNIPAAASAAAVQVWVNGTLQVYTTNYAVNISTRTITFVTAPPSGAVIVAWYGYRVQ